ncbi:hypothetical protein AXG93_2022s1050 [Marchantia polymorpha subsp. ruderalis]|uniref:Ferredoxin n=1 Tax=Marchantia polymorpha subsp. ruderalis TaxID=1480154 RepID=A0A176VXL2_MARPO|nr:hypothetical protein AXG93_2022s1050 [Marchantia polymorpha subsp. ruderalis]
MPHWQQHYPVYTRLLQSADSGPRRLLAAHEHSSEPCTADQHPGFCTARSCWTLVRAEATTSTSSAITQARVAVGEEPVRGSALHSVTVVDRQRGVTHKFEVPEDQYILHTGEDQDIDLPFSCRHGCCTACAVRVKSGQLYQPEALGISAELKEQGYGLLCVGYALSDLEVETQDEDEVYWLQFGRYFARGPVERDDFALELAMADE